MSKYGLARNLTNILGHPVDVDEAQEYIDMFYDTFPELKEWQEEFLESYEEGNPVHFYDWKMGVDNKNFRSIGNVPIQGQGSCIMRKAVELCFENDLKVIYTLHDAIYIECDTAAAWQGQLTLLKQCMIDACTFILGEKGKLMRVEADAWSPDFNIDDEKYTEIEVGNVKTKMQSIYVDERAIDEYKLYKKYLNKVEVTNLDF